jgi:hypothetical protein
MLVSWIAELVRALPSNRCNEECDDATQGTRSLSSRLYTPVIEASSETPHECVWWINGYEIGYYYLLHWIVQETSQLKRRGRIVCYRQALGSRPSNPQTAELQVSRNMAESLCQQGEGTVGSNQPSGRLNDRYADKRYRTCWICVGGKTQPTYST